MTEYDPVYQANVDGANARVRWQQTQWASLDRQLTPMAKNAAGLAKMAPEMSPELVTAFVLAGQKAEELPTPAFSEIRRKDAIANDSNWWGIEPMIRGGMTVFESLWQSKQRNERFVLGLLQGQGIGESWDNAGTTLIDEVIRTARKGEPINLGSGWTQRSTLPQNQPGYQEALGYWLKKGVPLGEAQRRATETSVNRYGKPLSQYVDLVNEFATGLNVKNAEGQTITVPWSLGRGIAQYVAPAETQWFDTVSGMIDGYNRIFGDPIDVPLRELWIWRRNRNMWVPAGGDEMFREVWDNAMHEINVLLSPENIGIDLKTLGIDESENLMGLLPGPQTLDKIGHTWPQDPEKMNPILLFRERITRYLKRLDNPELGDRVPDGRYVDVFDTDGNKVDEVLETFEHRVRSEFGDDPEILDAIPEWQRGKLTSPYAQAYLDEGMTNDDLRDLIYYQGGERVLEDYILEHELIHGEKQIQRVSEYRSLGERLRQIRQNVAPNAGDLRSRILDDLMPDIERVRATCDPVSKGACVEVSTKLADEIPGLRVNKGSYGGMQHAWNELPDGTIIDATADQFGGDPIRVIKPSDPDYAKYSQVTSIDEAIWDAMPDFIRGHTSNAFAVETGGWTRDLGKLEDALTDTDLEIIDTLIGDARRYTDEGFAESRAMQAEYDAWMGASRPSSEIDYNWWADLLDDAAERAQRAIAGGRPEGMTIEEWRELGMYVNSLREAARGARNGQRVVIPAVFANDLEMVKDPWKIARQIAGDETLGRPGPMPHDGDFRPWEFHDDWDPPVNLTPEQAAYLGIDPDDMQYLSYTEVVGRIKSKARERVLKLKGKIESGDLGSMSATPEDWDKWADEVRQASKENRPRDYAPFEQPEISGQQQLNLPDRYVPLRARQRPYWEELDRRVAAGDKLSLEDIRGVGGMLETKYLPYVDDIQGLNSEAARVLYQQGEFGDRITQLEAVLEGAEGRLESALDRAAQARGAISVDDYARILSDRAQRNLALIDKMLEGGGQIDYWMVYRLQIEAHIYQAIADYSHDFEQLMAFDSSFLSDPEFAKAAGVVKIADDGSVVPDYETLRAILSTPEDVDVSRFDDVVAILDDILGMPEEYEIAGRQYDEAIRTWNETVMDNADFESLQQARRERELQIYGVFDEVSEAEGIAREATAEYLAQLQARIDDLLGRAMGGTDEGGDLARSSGDFASEFSDVSNQLDRIKYEIEYEAEREAIRRLKRGKLSTSGLREKVYKEAGIGRWWRPWLKTRTVDDLLNTKRGRRLIDYTTRNKSISDIRRLYSHLPAGAQKRLAETDDPAEVVEIIRRYAGGARMPDMPTMSRTQRAADKFETFADVREYSPVAQGVRRWVAQSGDMILDPFRIKESMDAAESWLWTVGADRTEVDRLLTKLAGAEGDMGKLNEVWEEMLQSAEARIRQLGYTQDEITTIMSDIASKNIQAKLYFDNLAGRNTLLYNTGKWTARDGTTLGVISGHLPSEFSHNFIIMPNMRNMRRATSRARSTVQKMRRHYPESWWRGSTGQFTDPLGIHPNLLAKLLDPMAAAWRNLALLRVGWPLRVIPEELIRMQAAGYTDTVRHPFSYLALVFGDTKGRIGIMGDNLDDVFTAKQLGSGQMAVDWTNTIRGTAWDAANASWAIVHIGNVEEYKVGLAREILDLWGSDVSRHVAGYGVDETFNWLRNTKEGQRYLENTVNSSTTRSHWRATVVGDLSPTEELADQSLRSVLQSIEARIHKNTGGHYVARQIDPHTTMPTGKWVDDYDSVLPLDRYDDWSMRQLRDELARRDILPLGTPMEEHLWDINPASPVNTGMPTSSDEMIDALLRDDGFGAVLDADNDTFFIIMEEGDARIRQMINSGELDGTRHLHPEMSKKQMRDFENNIVGLYQDQRYLPETVKSADVRQSRNLSQVYDSVTDEIFNVLMGVPTRKLIRSPFARMRYTEEVARGYIFSTPETRAEILRWVDESGMRVQFDEFLEKAMRDINLRALPDEVTDAFQNMKEIDTMAKARAVEDTRELFYDLSKRGNWADATRLIFPFADAWWEVISRWAKFLDPTGLVPGRHAGQVFEAMRNSRKAAVIINGARTNGYFSEDKYGNEVFNWPGFGLLAGHLPWGEQNPQGSGVGMSSTTTLESLMFIDPNIRGILAPGTGPIAQLAGSVVQPLLPSQLQPMFQDAIFGEFDPPPNKNPLDLIMIFAPTWAKRISEAAFPNYRQVFADTITGLYASTYLSNNPMWGDLSQRSSDERMRWAQSQGSQLAILRIFDAIISPSQPTYEPEVLLEAVQGPQGATWVKYQALMDEYRTARRFYQNDIAAGMYMLENFGVDFLDLIPETIQVYQRPTRTEEYLYLEDNAYLRAAAPYTLMAWVPAGDDDDFSYYVYQQQFFEEDETGTVARQVMTPEMAAAYHNSALGFRVWNNVQDQYNQQLERARVLYANEPNRLRQFRNQLDDWKAQQRDAIHTRYWAWGFDREIPGRVTRPTYRTLFDEMARLPEMSEMRELNPQLADWITVTTGLWRHAEEQSMAKGYDIDWWRTSEPQTSTEPEQWRQWFFTSVEDATKKLTDPVARQGAQWYMSYVLSRLLNGVEWDDSFWFELEQAPIPGTEGAYTYDQINDFTNLPGHQAPIPEWQQRYEQEINP